MSNGGLHSCDDYRDAAITLWGEAGAFAHDSYARWLHLYPGLPETLPIVIGITAYGHCVGLTRGSWEHGPRITLFSPAFDRGTRYVEDIIVHECLHAWLYVTGRKDSHDSEDWYEAIRRCSPAVLGHEVKVRRGQDRKSVRVPNPAYEAGVDDRKTVVRKVANPGVVQHRDIATWPHSFRPADYDWGSPLRCPTY